MALLAPNILEVQNGGSDTNGGAFGTNNTMATDGAATSATTSAPVFTSATYNFVAGDVGAWLFIKSGSNWIPGWYQIASVAANAATLTAGSGTAQKGTLVGSAMYPMGLTTVNGCATTGSPTAATWTIDYSRGTAIALTGLTSAGAGSTILSASATKAMVGNVIYITGGTNFTVGAYQITAVTAGVSFTVNGSVTTGAGAAGTGNLGGPLATIGAASPIGTAGAILFVQYNASANVMTTATSNVSGGSPNSNSALTVVGYNTTRTTTNTDSSRPTYQIAGSLATATLSTARWAWVNIIWDGNNQTTSKGNGGAANSVTINCDFINFTSTATNSPMYFGKITGCSANAATVSAVCVEAYSNTATPFSSNCFRCVSYNNTGASTDGFTGTGITWDRCVSYGNGRNGFNMVGGALAINCHAENNAAYGYANAATVLTVCAILRNSSDYNNTSGRANGVIMDIGGTSLSASAFVNAAGNNFSLDTTNGASLKATAFPGLFPRGNFTDYSDIGAVQHQDAGSSGMLYVPNLDGV